MRGSKRPQSPERRLVDGDLDLRRREDEDRLVSGPDRNHRRSAFWSLRALQAVEYRRHSLWNFPQIVTTLYDIDTWSRRMFDAVDSKIKTMPQTAATSAVS